ncbi:MAG: hypothetical protein MUE87_05845 [Methanothrix sp.]|nr:hypothetical protein [Methanothrix sp.]
MNRILLALVALAALALLADGISMVNLGGEDGNQIFYDLTNNSTNSTGNVTLNLRENSSLLFLGGEDANSLLKNLANDSENLSLWGKPPRPSPLPPSGAYDPKRANTIAILRANHGF